MLHLVFDLQGVMAGFGDHSVGGQRRAATHVPRSAVLGVLHACMGIDRRDVKKDHPAVAGLRLAIAQAMGGTMVDYHTALTPKKDKTVLSRRGYQTDLRAAVAVWGDEAILNEAHEALLHPAWMPYLGRRSCPLTAPLRPDLVDAPTLFEALRGRIAEGARVHGDKHPTSGFPEEREMDLAPDRPEATQGDRRTYARVVRYDYGGFE